jgi:drug/metabolite transporter (DMT)-like permease
LTSFRNTGLGALAVLSWGTLGALGALSSGLPPYLVLTFCFGIAACLGFAVCLAKGKAPASLSSVSVWLFAALLAAYHLAYLEAFHHADPIPVSLINYLWPACMIIMGNAFFNLSSGWHGYVGAALGFLGVAFLIGGDGLALRSVEVYGDALAFLGAVLWALFSNLRRIDKKDSTSSLTTICAGASLFCGVYGVLNGGVWPEISGRDVLVVLALGLGPAGGAFFLWDIGIRKGDAALLGVLGYSAPVLSTLLMVSLGLGTMTWQISIAIVLITIGGAIVGTRSKA